MNQHYTPLTIHPEAEQEKTLRKPMIITPHPPAPQELIHDKISDFLVICYEKKDNYSKILKTFKI